MNPVAWAVVDSHPREVVAVFLTQLEAANYVETEDKEGTMQTEPLFFEEGTEE